jgi:hypothetical protein
MILVINKLTNVLAIFYINYMSSFKQFYAKLGKNSKTVQG